MKQKYNPPKVHSGKLRTAVDFYEYGPSGPEPGDYEKTSLFTCFAEVYNSSMKDLELLSTVETKEAVTITIRDTKGEYTVTNKHFVEIFDYRYTGKRFNVIDVRHDVTNNDFVTVVLGLKS